ncbi:integrin beta-6-like [Ostrea edulis]|uniref:integrin beta-6-like n=1 Tax=Ostrea edulis TaxID=37623 RepID=UPI0024AFDFEC|nr:integrin beta-6-like [Ostrea edulis]XP_048746735.2 integrin beta-6-like [Ostrea edulis]
MRILCFLSLSLVFNIVVSEERCFGNTCEECMKNSEYGGCVWCGVANYTASRCFSNTNFNLRSECRGGFVHWPTKLTYVKSRQFAFIGNDIIKFVGRKGGIADHMVVINVPNALPRKKVTVVFILPRPGKDAPVEFSFDITCRNRVVSKKNPYKVKCKRLTRDSKFYINIKLKYLKDMSPRDKRKYKLKLKMGKQRHVLKIFTSGIEPCQCSTKKTRATTCRWKNSKGNEGNNKCVCTESDVQPTVTVPTVEEPVGRPMGGGIPSGAVGGGMGGGRFTIPEESLNQLPMGSSASDIECEECKNRCSDYGKCVDCFVFSGSPMPNARCRRYCGGRRFAPTFRRVRGFPDDVNKCTYTDESNCIMKFQIMHERSFEVSMRKDCPIERCQNTTCPADSDGNVCSNNGVCKCGRCECKPMYSGDSCERCQNCGGRCNELRDCVACTSFSDFSAFKDEEECGKNCAKFNIRPFGPFVPPQSANSRMCQVYNKNNCFSTYAYTELDNGVTEVQVLPQQVCPDDFGKK